MPKGLKQTSSQIVISFGLQESAPNTFTTDRVDLQLNALDNEVFVVTGVKMDISTPDFLTGAGTNRFGTFASISKQDITNSLSRSLDNPSIMATSNAQVVVSSDGTNLVGVTHQLENSADSPFHVDYVDIIATPDFYVNINGVTQQDEAEITGKLYGYRARADASVYASLVQSELLSA